VAGTLQGGRMAAKSNKERHGADYYVKLGKLGGVKGTKDGTIKGFAAMDREKVRQAGRIGGQVSRRSKKS
jgi:hypothetical protein